MKNVFALIFVSFFALSLLSCDQSTGPNNPPTDPFPAPSSVTITGVINTGGLPHIGFNFVSVQNAVTYRFFIRHQSNTADVREISLNMFASNTIGIMLYPQMTINFIALTASFPGFFQPFHPDYPERQAGFQFGVRSVFPDNVESASITWSNVSWPTVTP